MKKIICVGEMLLDFVCVEENVKLSDATQFVKKTGVAPANVAACIGKLGGLPYIDS